MHPELGEMVLAREQANSQQDRQARRAVAPREVHAAGDSFGAVPFDGHPVGGVLGGQPDRRRQVGRPQVTEPDEADPGHAHRADRY